MKNDSGQMNALFFFDKVIVVCDSKFLKDRKLGEALDTLCERVSMDAGLETQVSRPGLDN
jgi:hypothetical protein